MTVSFPVIYKKAQLSASAIAAFDIRSKMIGSTFGLYCCSTIKVKILWLSQGGRNGSSSFEMGGMTFQLSIM
ncbi:hypothetical protein D3C87_467230 [compost metagenome]